jgi:hypothetical protein
MRRFRVIVAALLASLAPMLMAPTGGYPTRPTFTTVTVKSPATGNAFTVNGYTSTPGALVIVDGQTGASVSAIHNGYCNGNVAGSLDLYVGGIGSAFCISATGAITTPLATSVPWAVSTSGSGTLTYSSGCTAGSWAPAFTWAKTGNMAAMTIGASSCTSTAATIIATGVPAAIQPTNQHPVVGICESNSVNVYCSISVTGSVSITPLAAFAATSGTGSTTVVYPLN